jgi:non-homologous end joining protein Ku
MRSSKRSKSRAHTIIVPVEQIDPRYFDSPYYIVPNENVGQDAVAVIRPRDLR